MTSVVLYTALIGAVLVERLAEQVVSKRHLRWAVARGGVEVCHGHYPAMVAVHTGLLAGAVAEVIWLDRPFVPLLGWPMLLLALACQALRWWCITTLGPHWNVLVVVIPGMTLVRSGPYRWLRHPNYVAVVVEGVALPLMHGAWLTALLFTVLNAGVLTVRIRCENRALATAAA